MNPLLAFVYYILQSYIFEFLFRTISNFVCGTVYNALLSVVNDPGWKELTADLSHPPFQPLAIVNIWKDWAPTIASLIRLVLFFRLGYRLISYYAAEQEVHQVTPPEAAQDVPEDDTQSIPDDVAHPNPIEATQVASNEAARAILNDVAQAMPNQTVQAAADESMATQVTSTSAPSRQYITILAYTHNEQLERRIRALEDRITEILEEEEPTS